MSTKKQMSKRVDKGLEQQIDESIRRVYQESLSDEIPERFRSLLDKLRQQDGSAKDNSGGAAGNKS